MSPEVGAWAANDVVLRATAVQPRPAIREHRGEGGWSHILSSLPEFVVGSGLKGKPVMTDRKRDWTDDPRLLPPAILTLVSVLVMIGVGVFDVPAIAGYIAFACFVLSAVWGGILVSRRARERGSPEAQSREQGLWTAIKWFFRSLP